MDVFGRSGFTAGEWKRRNGKRWSSGGTSRSAWVGGGRGGTGNKGGLWRSGVQEIDEILATFEEKEIRRAVTRATDDTIKKYVAPAFIRNVEEAGLVETGALRDVAKKRRIKRSRTRFGSELFIDRVKVIVLRRARGGRIGWDKKRNEDFFYPAAMEFGTDEMGAPAPLRRALLGNTTQAIAEFHKYLRLAVEWVRVRAAAKKNK